MIRSIIETSLVDWDGKISSVIFFDRCNFRCPFCHNWELFVKPENFKEIPVDVIISRLKKKSQWIDGLVMSGGEPFVYYDKTYALARKIKKMGFGVKIDTNGYYPDRLKKIVKAKLVDYVAMDIKAPLESSCYSVASGIKIHAETTVERIMESVKFLMTNRVKYEFRTTCVPGIVDESTVIKIGEAIKGCELWVLQSYIPDNAYNVEDYPRRYKAAELEALLKIARGYAQNAKIRGYSS